MRDVCVEGAVYPGTWPYPKLWDEITVSFCQGNVIIEFGLTFGIPPAKIIF